MRGSEREAVGYSAAYLVKSQHSVFFNQHAIILFIKYTIYNKKVKKKKTCQADATVKCYHPHQLLQVCIIRRKPQMRNNLWLCIIWGYSGSLESLELGRSMTNEGHVPPAPALSLQLRRFLSSTVQNATCDIQPSNNHLGSYSCAELDIIHEKLEKTHTASSPPPIQRVHCPKATNTNATLSYGRRATSAGRWTCFLAFLK